MSDDAFETFWKAYPRKVGKGAARRVWQRLRPTPALVHKMLQAVAWQRTQDQWTRDGGAYIPHPSTWLHQERWDDEPMEMLQARAMTPPSFVPPGAPGREAYEAAMAAWQRQAGVR